MDLYSRTFAPEIDRNSIAILDTNGNLIYRATTRNFNLPMAGAGKITIAEVEELVPAGELDPDQIHTPGICIKRIFQGATYEKRIEKVTARER